jgi:hypothetical protein
MIENKLDLYCSQCEKNYTIKEEELNLVLMYHPSSILFEKKVYRFDGGCFFKELALLRRQEQSMHLIKKH